MATEKEPLLTGRNHRQYERVRVEIFPEDPFASYVSSGYQEMKRMVAVLPPELKKLVVVQPYGDFGALVLSFSHIKIVALLPLTPILFVFMD